MPQGGGGQGGQGSFGGQGGHPGSSGGGNPNGSGSPNINSMGGQGGPGGAASQMVSTVHCPFPFCRWGWFVHMVDNDAIFGFELTVMWILFQQERHFSYRACIGSLWWVKSLRTYSLLFTRYQRMLFKRQTAKRRACLVMLTFCYPYDCMGSFTPYGKAFMDRRLSLCYTPAPLLLWRMKAQQCEKWGNSW